MEKLINGMFEYHKTTTGNNDDFIISPSGIGNFFKTPSAWYKEHVLKTEKSFLGNTNSVLGTICHKIYELHAQGYDCSQFYPLIDEELQRYCIANIHLELDYSYIVNTYPLVAQSVIDNYLSTATSNAEIERKCIGLVKENIFVGGRLDRLELTWRTNRVIDHKSVGKLPSSSNDFPFGYRLQTGAYAWTIEQEEPKAGENRVIINSTAIVYGIHPTKTIGARTYVAERDYDDKYRALMSDVLNLIADTVLKAKESPELVYLLFKDYRFTRDVQEIAYEFEEE